MRKKLSIEDEKYIIENYNNFSTKDLMLKFNVSKTPILRLLKKNNVVIKTSKIYDVDETYFEEINNEEKSYWLGFLYADGYVRMKNNRSGELKLKLKRSDKNHVELFRNCIGSNHKITDGIGKVIVSGRTYTSEYSSLSIYNTKLVKDLIKHGCTNKKTFTITFPELREDLIRHFIRGYFDGDGCISDIKPKKYKSNEKYLNKYFTFSIVSNKIFIKQMLNIFDKMNILCSIQIYDNYDILCSYDKLSILNMKEYIYNKSNIYLNRKKCIFDSINQ